MLKITRLQTENSIDGCITDNPNPKFSFSLESDRENVKLKQAII